MAELLVEKSTGNVIEVREDGATWSANEKNNTIFSFVSLSGSAADYEYLATETLKSKNDYMPKSLQHNPRLASMYRARLDVPVEVVNKYFLKPDNTIGRRYAS